MTHTIKIFFIILALASFALLINVGSYGLLESSDARYAEIARMMYISGDYMNPNLMEVHHFHKPPLTYQISSLGFNLFGVNPFAARFFLQIAVVLQLVLVYLLTLTLFAKKNVALMATMIYFSFPLVLIASRDLTTDAFLTLFVLLSLYAWVKYRQSGKYVFLYLFTLSLALGFMTKGPVIFIVPIIFMLFYNRIEVTKNSFSYHHVAAWLLFFIVGFSWYFYLIIHNPHFLDYFLGKQTVDRFSKNAFGRTEPFWYFVVLAPVVGLPWLLILPYLIKQKLALFKSKQMVWVLLMATMIPLFFFSVSSSKRILYILPFYGLFAILIAYLMTLMENKVLKVVNRIVLGYGILFFTLFIIAPVLPTNLVIPHVVSYAAFGLLVVIIWVYNTEKIINLNKSIGISFIVALFLVIGGSKVLSINPLKSNSTSSIAEFIKQEGLQERNILVYNTRKPSLAFHLNKKVISLYDGSHDLEREVDFEVDTDWKNYLIDMHKQEEVQHLKAIMKKPSVLLTYKHPLSAHSNWLASDYKHKKNIGRWNIFY